MRQAIEEGFILDVLENYTTFKRYFKLVKSVEADEEYERKKAIRMLTSYVDLQEHAIEMKTRIMLEHFLDSTAKAIQGRGRAMVITRSRLHAVRYYLMFKKVMGEKHIPFKPLVAFSGTVKDPDSLAEYTEKSLNRLLPRVSIEDAFKTPEYRILIAAYKFQTGFDEPYLHTMYVDKKLRGVYAVQALSRLNRTARGKANTIVLDFVNEAEDIQTAFQDYYQTTLLEEETDHNKLYDLQYKLREFEVFGESDVNDFAEVFYDPKKEGEKLQPILDRIAEVWRTKAESEREDFRSVLQRYIRLYGFVSQMTTFEDVELEKLYVLARNLNRKLTKREQPVLEGLLDGVDLDSFRVQETFRGRIVLEKDDSVIAGRRNGQTRHEEEERDFLSNIIKTLNDTYGVNLTDEDEVDMERIKIKLENDEELLAVMNEKNTLSNIRYKFDKVVDKLLLDFVHTKIDLYKKLSDPKVNELFKKRWFEGFQRYYYQQ
jgi:type I restriction enzyme R subunit